MKPNNYRIRLFLSLSIAWLVAGRAALAQEQNGEIPPPPKGVKVLSPIDGKTCVVSLIPEGTRVEKGDLVCELDAATVKVRLPEQDKKIEAAKVVYQQALNSREAAELAVTEYLEGVYKPESAALEGEIRLAQADLKRAEERFDWASKMTEKGFLQKDKKVAAKVAVTKATFMLQQAEGKKDILVKYTREKNVKGLKAKVEKARSEELEKLALLELAREEKVKLSRQIDACKIVAPVAGRVVYPPTIEEAADVLKGAIVFRVVPEDKEKDKVDPCADTPNDKDKVQEEKSFEREITIKVKMKYLLFLPEGYEGDKEKRWPLMLFLHGAGESGDDLAKVKAHGPPKLVESKKDFPFVVVSPQSPGRGWNPDTLFALIEDIKKSYRVDADRVYLTGLSMGGYGSWALSAAHPEVFAAIAPICGGGNPKDASKIKDLPIWVFHGAKDSTVPLARSEEMVKALKEAGAGEVKFTVYPEAGHDSWTETYNNAELYKWLLGHTRKK